MSQDELVDVQDSYDKWFSSIQEDLNKRPARRTSSGVELKPLYTALDVKESSYNESLGFPGEFPYTRGPYALMHRERLWGMLQYSGYATAEETNKHYKFLLKQGATGMSVAFHLLSQVGMDSDNPDWEGDVGGTGVAIDSLADMETLFQDIPLGKISTSFTINATSAVILAMYIVTGEKQGVEMPQLRGTLQNDILKEYVARGAFRYPVGPSLRLITDTVEFCFKNVPKFNTISASGYHIRESGGSAVEEIAFTFCNAMTYIRHAVERGLTVDQVAPQISWNFAVHMHLFEEVAKLRAARRLWARLLTERFGAKDPKSVIFRLFGGNGGSTLTLQQPDNNVIRGTIGAMALVLSGCQAATVNTREEGLAIPSPYAQQLALRTQQILAYEAGLADVIDPLGGSYYVEALTTEYEEKILALVEEIEAGGGIVKAVEEGIIQRRLAESDYEYTKKVQSGEIVKVGVNKFITEEEPKQETKLYKRDLESVNRQIQKTKQLKLSRDNGLVEEKLKAVSAAAASNENIMPALIEAVRVYATIGEISQAMEDVFGRFKEPNFI